MWSKVVSKAALGFIVELYKCLKCARHLLVKSGPNGHSPGCTRTAHVVVVAAAAVQFPKPRNVSTNTESLTF